jgi:CheY-like chemotaxis protein
MKHTLNSKILIVEDDNLIAKDLEELLKGLDYNTLGIVSNGKDAIKITEEKKPDLILMDIVLKGELDGIQTAQIIKENYNTPFIYLTAYYDKEVLKIAQKTQPAAYITKPYEEKELQTAIQLAIQPSKNL